MCFVSLNILWYKNHLLRVSSLSETSSYFKETVSCVAFGVVSINLPITPASLLLLITEALTEEAVSFGAVSFLLGFVKHSLHSNAALCQMALSAVSVLISSGKFLNITGSSLSD